MTPSGVTNTSTNILRLPDPNPVSPPHLPETPLYPRLHTNTPVPSMTYPGFPFPPGTPLYPSHEHIEWYHQDYVKHFNLSSYIRFNHTVVASSWVGSPQAGQWNITLHDHNANDNGKEHVQHRFFDHLVIATGNNHYPHIPSWPGQEAWLAGGSPDGPRREILHSVWYREPERYAGQTVVIVGSGASGRDAAIQVGPIARKVSGRRLSHPPMHSKELERMIYRHTYPPEHHSKNGLGSSLSPTQLTSNPGSHISHRTRSFSRITPPLRASIPLS